MKLVEANVLLYAVNSDAHHHQVAKAWLDRSLNAAALALEQRTSIVTCDRGIVGFPCLRVTDPFAVPAS